MTSDTSTARSTLAGFQLSRRGFLAGLGAAGAALVLAGCTTRGGAPIESGSASVRLWTHDPSYITTFQTAAADPKLMKGSAFSTTISPVSANGQDLMSRTIAQAVAGSEGPDMLGIIISEFPRVMKPQMAENLFVDLNDVTAALGSDLLRTAPYSQDGKTYALESDASISVFYYRADEFDALGIDPNLRSWSDYLEVGGEIFASSGKSLGMVSNGDNTSIFNSFLQLLLQRGGSPFDESGRLAIDSDEATEVLEFIQQGVKNGTLLVLGDPYGSAAASALKFGTLIATVMPSWYNVYGLQANAPDQAGNWRMRTIPKFDGGGHVASNLGGTGFAVGLGSPGRDAALDLLQRTYLTPEGQLLRYQTGGYLPTIASLYEDAAFTEIRDDYLGGQRVFDVYREAAKDLPSFYQSATMQQLSTAMGGPLLSLYNGSMTPAQTIAATVEGYKQQTRQGA